MPAPRLRQIAPNFTSVELANGAELFFSYETCVAISSPVGTARTATKFSTTTSRQINKAGLGEWPELRQLDFDELVNKATAA